MLCINYKLLLFFPLFLILLGCDDPPATTPCFIRAQEFRAKCYPQKGEPYFVQIEAMDKFMCLSVDDTANLLRWIENVKR